MSERELRQLYQRLIGPVEQELGLPRRLLILPSGLLAYVPFAALRTTENCSLVQRVWLSYSPSLAFQRRWIEVGKREGLPREAPALVLGFGPDLPAVEHEIAQVSRHLSGRVQCLSGAEATTAALATQAPGCRVLHLACHGRFRRDHPMFSSLILADGRLSFYDLFRMRLRADLVVLSACETGHSDGVPGEELVGLAGGFLMAGARAVVVSLWEVIDASSAELMDRLYARLSTGSEIAEALAEAMIDLQAAAPHPAHWAPYILLGDPAVRIA
jgi:CHAT domain-containing protein